MKTSLALLASFGLAACSSHSLRSIKMSEYRNYSRSQIREIYGAPDTSFVTNNGYEAVLYYLDGKQHASAMIALSPDNQIPNFVVPKVVGQEDPLYREFTFNGEQMIVWGGSQTTSEMAAAKLEHQGTK